MAVEVFLSGPLVPSLPWLSPPHTQKKGLHGMQLETSFFPNSPGFDREILPEMGQLGILGATIKGQFGNGMSVAIMLYSCISLHTVAHCCILLYTLVYFSYILSYILVYCFIVAGYGCAGASSVAYGLIAREVER